MRRRPKKGVGKSPEIKSVEAAQRQTEYDKLTTVQKIQLLDERLGKGIGAKKQRIRLAAQLVIEQNNLRKPQEAKK